MITMQFSNPWVVVCFRYGCRCSGKVFDGTGPRPPPKILEPSGEVGHTLVCRCLGTCTASLCLSSLSGLVSLKVSFPKTFAQRLRLAAMPAHVVFLVQMPIRDMLSGTWSVCVAVPSCLLLFPVSSKLALPLTTCVLTP